MAEASASVGLLLATALQTLYVKLNCVPFCVNLQKDLQRAPICLRTNVLSFFINSFFYSQRPRLSFVKQGILKVLSKGLRILKSLA